MEIERRAELGPLIITGLADLGLEILPIKIGAQNLMATLGLPRRSTSTSYFPLSFQRAVARQARGRTISLQRGSAAHARNGRDPAVDQEVCPDDVGRIVRREVNCQLRDFQRIGHPLAWIVGSEDVLNRLALLFAWEATEHRRVRRAWA